MPLVTSDTECRSHAEFRLGILNRAIQPLLKLKIYQDHVHYNLRKYFFTNRVTCTCNSLPDSVIETNSVNSFRNRIDKCWSNFEFKYNWKADPTGPEAVVKVF